MSIQSNFPAISPSLLLDFASTKQLDNRVTFTRSTSAVYYDGRTTAMAEQNLLTYSQAFDNAAWSKYVASITADTTTAPDGTTTADTFTPTGTNPLVYQLSPSAGTFTFSVYAKALVDTSVTLACTTGFTGVAVQFNLSAGTAGSVTSYSGGANATITGGTASIVSVGNGWYRCILANVTVTTSRAFHFGSGGTNGTSTGTIYAWGAQLEQRSSATAYTATTTQAITNYIPVLLTAGGNQPRFDCNPTTGESLGLLIEEQRTNVLSYSSDLSNTYWDKFQLNLTSNTIIAPDGTLTGDKLASNTVNTSHYSYPASGIAVSAGIYTASIYAKAGERSRLIAGIWSGSDYAMAQFDLANGTIVQEATAGMASITPVGNGWYRCTVNRTIGAVTTYFSFGPYINGTFGPLTGAFPQYADDGFSGIYVWGAQLEASSFATSYIATTSASATRTVDSAVMTGTNFSSWANSSAFTVFTKVSRFANALPSQESIWSIAQSSPLQVVSGLITTSPAYRAYFESAADMSVSYPNLANVQYSVIQAYQTDNFAACANGGTVSTDNSGAMNIVSGFDTLYLGRFTSPQNQFNGYISKFAYYPLRLSNTNLQALTS